MAIKRYRTKRGIRYAYEIQFNHQRYSKGGYLTKRQAQEEEVTELKRLKESGDNLDFRLLIVERLKHVKATCTEAYYLENHRTMSKLTLHFPDKTFVNDITREEIEHYLATTYPKKHGYNYALARINALFHYGVERGWTKYNPCDGIKRRTTDKKLKYVPTKEDLDKVINYTETYEEMAFLLVLKHTMARVNEIYNLKWEDIDHRRNTITLWTRKKRGGVRTPRHLTINRTLVLTLDTLPITSEYVFVNRDGQPYTDRKKMLMGVCKRAGVQRFTFHSFRHFGASQLAMKGVSLPEIQMILGHDNVITTSKYIQSLGINKTEAINLLE